MMLPPSEAEAGRQAAFATLARGRYYLCERPVCPFLSLRQPQPMDAKISPSHSFNCVIIIV